jgi:hypothetical protein
MQGKVVKFAACRLGRGGQARPVSMPTQGGETKRVRGVVGTIKAALQRVGAIRGIR